MKQGPLARTGLCCPSRRHYYDPLRLPLDRSPLPGIAGYKQACFPHPQIGAEEALSSSQDNLLTVPRPIRREVLEHPAPGSQVLSMAFAVKVSARLPLGSLTPSFSYDAAGFTSCCGPASCHPLNGM